MSSWLTPTRTGPHCVAFHPGDERHRRHVRARKPRHGWHMPEMVPASLGGAASYTHTDEGRPVYGNGHRFQYLAGQYLLRGADRDDRNTYRWASTTRAPPGPGPCRRGCRALLPYGTTQYAYNGTAPTVERSGPRFLARSRWISPSTRRTVAGLGLHVGSRGRRRPVQPFRRRFANIDASASSSDAGPTGSRSRTRSAGPENIAIHHGHGPLPTT